MRFLSTGRRHPAIKTLFLALALIAMGAFYAGMAPVSQSSADGGNSTQVEEGRKLYEIGCSSCHGLQAEGTSQGPTLAGVGSASVDFQMGTGRMPAAQPGAQMPRKENRYTDEEIAAIAAYIDTFGPGLTIPEPEQYSAEGLSEEDIARGGELFRTNCSACHNFSGKGGALPEGKYAPTLEGVDDKHIWEAMRTGPQQMPVFSQEVMTDQDTREIIAYLNHLHERPNDGGMALGGLGPVPEGAFAWIAGIGVLVGFAVWIAAKGVRVK
ncbi:c-type cytochrome [Propionibacteriaceae bacterium Y1685]|uniref:cytochrome bc1 complex diheme cytochrome c subunit n=1 Tax=Microlunatus sp. Y1700 TaxID=3418487 RepID=UPI003B7DB7BE